MATGTGRSPAKTARAKPLAVRYPFGPLASTLGVDLGQPGRRNEAPDVSHGWTALAEHLGFTARQMRRRRHAGGLTVWEADMAACRLGRHPSEIWFDWGEELLDAHAVDEAGHGWSA